MDELCFSSNDTGMVNDRITTGFFMGMLIIGVGDVEPRIR